MNIYRLQVLILISLLSAPPIFASDLDLDDPESYAGLYGEFELGLGHETNILFTRTGDITHASPTNEPDMRYRAKAIVGFNFFENEKSRMDLDFNSEYIYSDQTESSLADPWTIHVSAPYEREYQWGQLEVAPYFFALFQDTNLSGNRDNALTRFGVRLVRKASPATFWDTEYYIDGAFNASNDRVPADDNTDGARFALGMTHSMATSGDKTSLFDINLEASQYAAEGDNQKYGKFLLGIGYSDNFFFKNSSWTSRLETYYADFADSQVKRRDTRTSLLLDVYKSLNESWHLKASGSFATNTSKVNNLNYDQWTSQLGVVYRWSAE